MVGGSAHVNRHRLGGLMHALKRLEADAIYILREVRQSGLRTALLWSFGKDSNVLLHLARKAFFGELPFALLHCDTGLEFDEVYAFRDQWVRAWNLPLESLACPPLEATDPTLPPAARVAARKTLCLKEAVQARGLAAVITAIRRDEEPTRAKERVVSPRLADGSWQVGAQPLECWGQYALCPPPGGSLRIHPLLGWTERDIWRYIERESIPVPPLYFARPTHLLDGRDFAGRSMRFRSLGERGITWPVESNAGSIAEILAELEATRSDERAGRPMGAEVDESSFERLRAGGYL